jgi:OTU-like cysteine protease
MIEELVVTDVAHDGACLFHALGAQLGVTGADLRAYLVFQMQTRRKSLVVNGTLLEDWVQWNADTCLDTYARAMSMPYAWGGGLEMAIIARLSGRPIRVYTPTLDGRACKLSYQFPESDDEHNTPKSRRTRKPQPIRVLFVNNSHFMILEKETK